MSDKYVYVIFFGIIIIIIIAKLIKQRRLKIKIESTNNRLDKIKKSFEKNRNTILIGVFSYIALFVSFAILLPEKWEAYWSRQDFFWISQVYIGMMIALRWFYIRSMAWVFRIAFTIIILLYIIAEFPLPSTTDTIHQISYTQTEKEKGSVVKIIDTPELVRYKVKAVWGESVKIGTPTGFKFIEHKWDPDYDEIGNNGRLYLVRINESEIATEGLLDGKMTLASFSSPVRRIEFKSLCVLSDKNGRPILDEHRQIIKLPVYLIVDYTK